MEMKTKYTVATRCFTFNHSKFIEETMDGFVMQETNFPVVSIIVDDASTDGEQEVIKAYLKKNFLLDAEGTRSEETDAYRMIYSRHKYNENCFFAVYLLKYNHHKIREKKFEYISYFLDKSKYYAFCEGDDYWCHPKKLQMQIDFLKSHTDYGMVHTDFDMTEGIRKHYKERENDDGNWFPRIITEGLPVGSLTVVYRKDIYDRAPKLYQGKGWPMGDKPLWYELAHEAKVKYLPVVTSKYRMLPESASHSSDINKLIEFKNAGVEIRLFYANYYNIKLDTDGYGPEYYESIIRFAARLNEPKVAESYYNKAKEKKMLTRNARIFYNAAKYPIIKRVLDLYIKV